MLDLVPVWWYSGSSWHVYVIRRYTVSNMLSKNIFYRLQCMIIMTSTIFRGCIDCEKMGNCCKVGRCFLGIPFSFAMHHVLYKTSWKAFESYSDRWQYDRLMAFPITQLFYQPLLLFVLYPLHSKSKFFQGRYFQTSDDLLPHLITLSTVHHDLD